MTGDSLGEVIRRIGRSVALQSDLALTDAQLLQRFVARRDDAAFAALVVRHGPMVLGVCRRLVRDAQQAEDAFQATFLVLARKASSIQRHLLLAGWLYGVAQRVAVRLRGQTARRRTREERDVDLTALAAADYGADSDVRPLVHEEVGRLPDKYRNAVVLYYLEGKTNEEAALQLRWPVGSVKSRLARARDLLRTRPTRRGLTLSAGVLTTALVINKASAAPALVDATIRGAALFAAGDGNAGGVVTARAVKLCYGVLQTMIVTKAKIVAALALTLAMLGGAGGLAYRSLAAGPDDKSKAAPMKTASHDADRPKADADAEKIQGTWRVVAVETEGVKRNDEDARDQKTWTWTFRGNKLIVHIESPGPARDVKATFRLDSTQKPKAIDIAADALGEDSKEKTALRGIYSMEGDALNICYGLSDAEIQQSREEFKEPDAGKALSHAAGPRPKEMATKEGGKTTLLTLKRESANTDKPKEENPKAGESKADAEAIKGVWRVTAVETEGKERDDDRADRLKSQVWTIKTDKIYIKMGTIDQKGGCPYKIDPTKKPKTLDITEQTVGGDGKVRSERTRRAIYSLEGDVLKVCYGMSAAEIKHDDQDVGRRPRPFDPRDLMEDGGRPTELATKEGSRSMVITLKRKAADKDKPKDEQSKENESKKDVAAIQGVWRVMAVETEGKDQDDASAKLLKKEKWVFRADTVAMGAPYKLAGYKLDATKTPKTLDLDPAIAAREINEGAVPAIYLLDGDTLKICLGPLPSQIKQRDQNAGRRPKTPDLVSLLAPLESRRPKELATKEGGYSTLITLKRAAANRDDSKEEQPSEAPTSVKADDAKMTKLRLDWSDATKKAFEAHMQEFRAGKTAVMSTIDAAHRLLRAEIERSENKAGRTAAYEANLKRLTEIEDISKQKFEYGKLSIGDFADAKAARLEAEILLEREKAN